MKKMQLNTPKVASFVTTLSETEQQQVTGGYIPIIKNRKTINWTYVDTRAAAPPAHTTHNGMKNFLTSRDKNGG